MVMITRIRMILNKFTISVWTALTYRKFILFNVRGKTLCVAGLDPNVHGFPHRQYYLALSRVAGKQNLFVPVP